MAKSKKKIRRRKKTTIPLAIVAPIATQLATGPWPRLKAGNFGGAANSVMRDYTGYDAYSKDFDFSRMKAGALPLLVGLVVHKVAGKLGANRAIASTGIPWVRI